MFEIIEDEIVSNRFVALIDSSSVQGACGCPATASAVERAVAEVTAMGANPIYVE